jgi:hypothetical protein
MLRISKIISIEARRQGCGRGKLPKAVGLALVEEVMQ